MAPQAVERTSAPDVSKLEDVRAFALQTHGPVNLMVNNAGVMPLSKLEELKVEEWNRKHRRKHPQGASRDAAGLPITKKQGRGQFVNLSSNRRAQRVADGLRMLRDQAQRTPAGQWVRIVGGWSEFQFAERRMLTLDELNRAAPDTPVFVLHLYDRALLNRAALRAVGYAKDSPNPPGGQIVRDTAGNPTGILIARPNAMILYSTLAKGPQLPPEYQVNSSRHFMLELNRLGITSAIDAGGGFQNYGAGEMLVYSAADFGDGRIGGVSRIPSPF